MISPLGLNALAGLFSPLSVGNNNTQAVAESSGSQAKVEEEIKLEVYVSLTKENCFRCCDG